MSKVIDNIDKAFFELGQVDLGGIKLEEASPSLLDVRQYDLDVHVAMQPSALAYYGSLLNDIVISLESEEKRYKFWRQRMWGKAKKELAGGTSKATVGDIESEIATSNESEVKDWEDRIDGLKHQEGTLRAWFDAWKQKSFSLREYITIESDERKSSGSHYIVEKEFEGSDRGKGIERVRSLIQKNKEKNNGRN